MKLNSYAIKGDICYSTEKDKILTFENHYLVCDNGRSAGVFETLPEEYSALKVYDYTGELVIPGLSDLHIHAPQFTFRGLGMDYELIDWLNFQAFPEESRYSDEAYAKEAYTAFAVAMKNSATTRACIFATLHVPATEMLMDIMEKTGLKTYIGKVNMDRNSPDYLIEASAAESAKNTAEWIKFCQDRYKNTKPILTPRFVPSCSDALMKELQCLQQEYSLPVQSHLSENPSEVAWVKELCKEAEFYGDAYDRFGLFGRDALTVMAHCVYCEDKELQRIKDNGVFVAHCPQSNVNIASGVAPVRTFLDMGLRCGLGSDVAGGSSESIFRAMADAIQMSKIRWRLQDKELKPITFEEAFFLATKGGGEFFGQVGSFEKGYEFDAVVIRDTPPKHFKGITLRQRMERLVYLNDGNNVVHKYVSGKKIF
jgi:guanine deaminase